MKDVFDNPTLLAVAAKASESSGSVSEPVVPLEPFELVSKSVQDIIMSQVFRQQYHLSANQTVEDAYPCSSLQEGLLALTLKQPGSYIGNYVFRLPGHVQLDRFKAAWETTVTACANLRTRIVLIENVAIQILLQEPTDWDLAKMSLSSFMNSKSLMGYGTALSKFSIVIDKDVRYFVWTGHHAVYDGWSMRIVLDSLYNAYYGSRPRDLLPYSNFIKYTMELSEQSSRDFWLEQLSGVQQAVFPPATESTLSLSPKQETQVFDHQIDLSQVSQTSITKATMIRAAWGLMLSRYCDNEHVCFDLRSLADRPQFLGWNLHQGQ